LTIESGWPASGQTIGAAVPSESNKYIAVKAIIKATSGNVIVFQAFNDLWKDPGNNGVENSFVYPFYF
jgi:exo-beta-1,3-glucanase (GH17 family)